MASLSGSERGQYIMATCVLGGDLACGAGMNLHCTVKYKGVALSSSLYGNEYVCSWFAVCLMTQPSSFVARELRSGHLSVWRDWLSTRAPYRIQLCFTRAANRRIACAALISLLVGEIMIACLFPESAALVTLASAPALNRDHACQCYLR